MGYVVLRVINFVPVHETEHFSSRGLRGAHDRDPIVIVINGELPPLLILKNILLERGPRSLNDEILALVLGLGLALEAIEDPVQPEIRKVDFQTRRLF